MTSEVKLEAVTDTSYDETYDIDAVTASPKKPTRRKTKDTLDAADKSEDTSENESRIGEVSWSGAQLGVYKLNDQAVVPEFKTEQSACFDLSAVLIPGQAVKIVTHSQNVSTRKVTDRGLMIQQGERVLIPTGLVFDIPEGYCLEIYPRSGISFNRGISLNNCTAIIDSDYVEEVFVSINNISGGSQYIEPGERIAQAKLVSLVKTNITVVDKKPALKTSRAGGFGSTGSK